MFTGIIHDVGRLCRVAQKGPGKRLTISTSLDSSTFEEGESIAVNGVCLTVSEFQPGAFSADASPETLARSNLNALTPQDSVNLERALRIGDRLGGHFVLGHVDTTVELISKRDAGDFWEFAFSLPREIKKYLVPKGSIALEGVSLTVSSLGEENFTVALIPHTLNKTNLSGKKSGVKINFEADVLGKYVEKLLTKPQAESNVTMDLLARSGFLR